MIDNKILKWINLHVLKLSIEEKKLAEIFLNNIKKNQSQEINKEQFNELFNKNKQKLLGITYTPANIRERLTDFVLKELLKEKKIKDLKIIDPCCGSGLFTITLIQKLINLGLSYKLILQKIVYFSDIDKVSVIISLINIYEYFNSLKIDISKIKLNGRVENFIFSEKKYDAFITNPPYVKIQNISIEDRNYLKKKYPEMFFGSMGLSTIFLKKMKDDLNEKGVLGIITQNNLFTSNSAKKLRKEIQNNIIKIETFGSNRIFKGVNAYTCLFYLQKKHKSKFEFKKINTTKDLQVKSDLIENNKLHFSKWRLGNKKELQDIENLEKLGIQLGDACNIWVGIATQFDKGFTVFKKGNNWIGTDPNNNDHIIEDSVIKKLVRIADIQNEDSLKKNTRGIIYPYKILNRKIIDYNEKEFSDEFPKAYKYLLTWKNRLNERQKGKLKEDEWFKWGRIQSMFPIKNKLLTKTFDKEPNFYLDKSDSLFSNGYAVNTKLAIYELDFIKETLNSRIFNYYMKITSFEIEGDYQCYQKNFIERFNLPSIDIKTQKEIISKKNIDQFYIEYFKLNYSI